MIQPTQKIRLATTKKPADRSPILFQRWEQLLFLHWTIEPEVIRKTLPPGLHLDTWNGSAYLGVVPFLMKNVRPRFCPAVPGLSHFAELNLRTYVHDDAGVPGVWFYSLDAGQRFAVAFARTFFSLPYVHSRLEATVGPDEEIDFRCVRTGEPEQRFRYAPDAALGKAAPGSLEFFLVERYRLFSYNWKKGRLYIGQIHHEPYPLLRPQVAEHSTRLFDLNGFAEPGRPPDHALLSTGVDVTVYGLSRHTSL